ncbi:COG4223 family protein [Denitrobaculum tricleocarpae]|uniref:Uncharacterized protein n=1 Tax=Denitrobaculum tricleocarpae TaxID=2591009 RepID=A0A545TRI0_9PROT|nr:mitofilin family membrane protein [Denitrobaculum tricleocarpae]TQV79731.1 hypothetical protein FKG95_13575 [Denitrobaculum tricleocarpae]
MSDKNKSSGGSSPSQSESAAKGAQPVAQIIEAFGGLRPMAGKLKVAVSTVQGWKERDSIPTARHGEILSAAKAHNIALDPAVLSSSDHMTRNQTAKTASPQGAGITSPAGTAAVPGAGGPKDQDVKKDDKAPKATGPEATGTGPASPKSADSKPTGAASPASAAPPPAAFGAPFEDTPAKDAQAKDSAPKTAIPAAGGSKPQEAKTTDVKVKDAKAAEPKGAAASPSDSKVPDSKVGDSKVSAEPAAPAGKSGGGFSGFLMGVVVLALILAGAVYTRGHWLPLVETLPMMAGGEASGSGAAAEETAARIAALENKLADLEGQMQSALDAAPPNTASPDLAAVDQAIADANQRIDALDGTLEQLLAGGVVIAADGQSDGDTAASPGSVLDQQELAALKAQVEQLAGEIESGAGSAADPGASGQTAAQPDDTRLAELTARLDEIEQTVTGLEDPAERLSELDSRLDAAEQGVAALPALESRLSAELAALSETIPTGPSEDAGDAAMFLALLQLREALSGSGAFETELALVDGLAAEDAELKAALAPLSERAASGVAALPGLRVSFDQMAGSVVAAARGGEEDDWIAKTVRKVSEAVTIRPVGLVEGDDAGAVLARAEVKLEAGDLAGAVAELDALSGSAAEGAAAWRQEAEARLEAQKALSLLATRAATMIGLGG